MTPRHITNFSVKVLNIQNNDYVLDPTCGTDGFLVSSLDCVKKHSNLEQIDNFKKNNLFGIEQDDEVIALVNMVFIGDERHKMKEGNFMLLLIKPIYKEGSKKEPKDITGYKDPDPNKNTDKIKENQNPSTTKVLMNSPFALKKKVMKKKVILLIMYFLKW